MSGFPFRRPALLLGLAIAIPMIGGVPAHASVPTRASAVRLPSSCRDIHNHRPYARDGNYDIYNNGNVFTVYCYGMRSGYPREYINLFLTGPNVNYSQYTAGGASPGTNVRTTFTKLRVDPSTLTVDIGDLTFARSTGSLRHSGTTTVTSMPYGVAMSCVAPRTAAGTGNINLWGTPFQVDNPFTVGGYLPAGSAVVSNRNQVVNLTGGGYCGWINPAPPMFDPFNPSPGNYHLKLSCARNHISRNRQICFHVG